MRQQDVWVGVTTVSIITGCRITKELLWYEWKCRGCVSSQDICCQPRGTMQPRRRERRLSGTHNCKGCCIMFTVAVRSLPLCPHPQ
jgi:hypothetical protein